MRDVVFWIVAALMTVFFAGLTTRSARHIEAGRSTIQLALVVTGVIAVIAISAGVVMLFVSQTDAVSELKLLGLTVRTTGVGVISIVCGVSLERFSTD